MLKILQPKLNEFIPHVPTVKQAVFMNLTNREAFYGGAAGGGKSDALLMDALQNVHVKGYSAILFRKTYADLMKPGALIPRAKEWLMPFIADKKIKWREKERRFEFLDYYGKHSDIRSILQFGYLENANDRFNYDGGEYQYVGFDEVMHILLVNYLYLFSRLRRLKDVDIILKVRSASNPPEDGAQGQWVYNRFVNPVTKQPDTIFIPAGMDDNPHLDVVEYKKALEVLDPVTRARLRDGVWTIKRKGNMFHRDWFEEVDVIPANRRTVRYWDLAASPEPTETQKVQGSDPDYTAGVKISEANGVYYIEDIDRFRHGPAGVQERVKRNAFNDGKKTRIRMEEEPGSAGKMTTDFYGRVILKGFNFIGIRNTGDKVTRANNASAASEDGRVKILRGCRNKEAFYDEIESFPGGVHDDMVDAFSGAFNILESLPVIGGLPYDLPSADVEATGSNYWSGI